MGIKYIIFGLLFFINPNINIVDILPDCIGCAFILYGLKELADVAPELDSARTAVKRLLIVEIIKLALLASVPLITEKEKTYILLYVLVFGTLEAIFAIMGISSIVNGMVYTASRHGGTAPFRKESDVKTITAVFFIVKSALTALPELEYLQIGETGIVDENIFRISSFKEIFIFLNIFAVLALGLIWFFMTGSYLKAAAGDSEFIAGARTYYDTEIKPKKELFMMRNVKLLFLLLVIGAALMADIYFDGESFHGLNVLPDVLSAIFFTAACIVARRLGSVSKWSWVSLGIYSVSSLALCITTSYVAIVYGFSTIYRIPVAYTLSIVSIVLTVISAASNAAFFIFLIPTLSDIVKKYAVTKNDNGMQLKDKNEFIISSFSLKIKAICFAASFIAVVSILERIFWHLEIFSWWWMINIVVTIVWAVFLAQILNSIRDRIEYSNL